MEGTLKSADFFFLCSFGPRDVTFMMQLTMRRELKWTRLDRSKDGVFEYLTGTFFIQSNIQGSFWSPTGAIGG